MQISKSPLLVFCLLASVSAVWAHDGEVIESGGVQAVSNVRKLAFLIPNLYGPLGLTLPNPDHEAHFNSAFQSNFGPFNVAIATQLTSQPIPSPASGFTFTFDKALGVETRSAQSFGPLLTERAETIGRGKFFAGFAYQHFNFKAIDGVNLSNIPSVFTHQPAANPDFQKDIITTDNFIGVQIGQMTSFFTYGLSDRLDVSVALPLISAKLDVVSDAQIRRIGTGDDTTVHYFEGTGDRSRKQFSAAGSASGIGDIIVRVKATALKFRNGGLALGLDTRLPTGDEYDFLGTGAYGLKPFAAISFHAGHVAPHVNLGYQWNGESVLAGNVRTGMKDRLPSQIFWAAGADVGVTSGFTLAVDILGQRLQRASRVVRSDFTAADGQLFPQVGFTRGNLDVVNGSAGFKVNVVGRLLLSFNVFFKLNDPGLRDPIVPLIGLSYTF